VTPPDLFDVAIVGAGFGGLGAALSLAERGAKVVVLEALTYPGGCASTFTRGRARYESGATLFSGFAKGHLFDTWIQRHGLAVDVRFLSPVVELRSAHGVIEVPNDRGAFVEAWVARAGPLGERVRAFFREQLAVADALWSIFEDPRLLPPFGAKELLAHVARVPAYLPLLPWVGRPLERALEKHGLTGCAALRTYLDAVCQITVQTSAREAEAPFAMATMDYYFRGTGHVHGGIGVLAHELGRAVERLSGSVRYASRVDKLRREAGAWTLEGRKGKVRARHVVVNRLPADVAAMAGLPLQGALAKLDREVRTGWGATMLYLTLDPAKVTKPDAFHIELVDDVTRPFVDGNHVFVSVGAADEERAPLGRRTATVSTHVSLERLDRLSLEERGRAIADVQATMRQTIARMAPELDDAIVGVMPGSPRTFERFTSRHGGYVGGIPRRAGLSHYASLVPSPVARDLWLVGDSVFPGQSTLATAIGGTRVAEAILRS
jgi:phytoene dehydrogenase-like protein